MLRSHTFNGSASKPSIFGVNWRSVPCKLLPTLFDEGNLVVTVAQDVLGGVVAAVVLSQSGSEFAEKRFVAAVVADGTPHA